MVNVLRPSGASGATLMVTEVLTALEELTVPVTPVTLNVIALAPIMFVPHTSALIDAPGAAAAGLMDVIVAGCGGVTVKPVRKLPSPVTDPAGVVTVTWRGPGIAPASTLTAIGIDVFVPPGS